jgi:TonB family protein
MRNALSIALLTVVVMGCASPRRPVRSAADPAPQPVVPFSDEPVSFLVPSRRFSLGEVAIVRVCVASDRAITSTDVIESSGDPHFDTLALDWARSVRLRATPPPGGAPMQPCGEVRVEVRTPAEPRGLSRSDSSLG